MYRNLIIHLVSQSLTDSIPNWKETYLSSCKNHFSSKDYQLLIEISQKQESGHLNSFINNSNRLHDDILKSLPQISQNSVNLTEN